jgi:esterase/lipase
MFGLKEKYEQAWKMLIKPQRIKYQESNLGPRIRQYDNYFSYRKDFFFNNKWDNQVQVSLFIPYDPDKHENDIEKLSKLKLNRPCCIYLHSQSGNKIEGLSILDFCIESGTGLCVFDFSGCGKSEGEYSTLGWREQEDVEYLVNILLQRYKATKIILWGRSMGAVTALFYAKRHSMFVNSMVLDSPFSDIKVMVQDVVYENFKIPGALVNPILSFLSSTIKKKVNFDILELKPVKFAETCSVPCMFIIGKHDRLVFPKRVKEIFDAYKGNRKHLVYSDGDHASTREEEVFDQCYSFIEKSLKGQYPIEEHFHAPKEYVHNISPNVFEGDAADFEANLAKKMARSRDLHYNHQTTNDFYVDVEIETFGKKYEREQSFGTRAKANSIKPNEMRRGEYGDSEDEDDYYNDVNDDFQQEDSFNYIAQMDEGDQQKGYEVINRVSESFYSRKSEPYEGFGGFA